MTDTGAISSPPAAPRDGHCRLEMHLRSDPARVAAVRRIVESMVVLGGFDQAAGEQIGLCLNEALANVIRHAYNGQGDQPISLAVEQTGNEIRLTIRDWGNGVNPAAQMRSEPKDPLTPGGVGMVCLKGMMDEVIFEPQPDGMRLILIKRRH